ncbi:MAG TPA: class D beta-lactamase [Devosia sp.]|nr:class D beta-lactamase [Devosia sp.]
MKHLIACLIVLIVSIAPARAKTICIVIADADSGVVLLEQGDCRSRVTPASTFKIALSVMGFDSGFLSDVHTPALPFKTGYADWGGANWKQPTDPIRWLKYSVVWFSQQITAALGVETLERYALAFGYGNADFAGDAGKNNALERAWISSSLKIAPVEQVAFLRNLINRNLPVRPRAVDMTMAIVETTPAGGGWVISGKTGSAYPRLADGSFNRAKGWGWFVGWATKAGRTLVFARLDQDEKRERVSAGIRAKEALLDEWQGIVAAVP